MLTDERITEIAVSNGFGCYVNPSDEPDEVIWFDSNPSDLCRAIEAEATAPLLKRIAELEHALAECRDAYPTPEVGSALESLWGQAMGDPESVGAYVKARALSAAPAAQPEFKGVAKRKLDDLIAQGYRIDGYAITKDTSRGFVTTGGMVGWWASEEEIQRIEKAAAERAAPAAQPSVLSSIRALIADDSYAMTFQSLGQYRSSLLSAISAAPAAPAAQPEPMFWVRLRGDGLYEGPIHNAQIEEVRKQSGQWTPLYLGIKEQP